MVPLEKKDAPNFANTKNMNGSICLMYKGGGGGWQGFILKCAVTLKSPWSPGNKTATKLS